MRRGPGAECPCRGEGRGHVPTWIDTLGVHFQSEHLFEAPARVPFPGGHGSGRELSSQANSAGLQGLGLGGVWQPFRNGFQLNFAMYIDPVESSEPEAFRSRAPSDPGFPSDDLVSFPLNFEAISYVGLGWKTDGPGLGVNLDVGAFLSEEYSLRSDACLAPLRPRPNAAPRRSGAGEARCPDRSAGSSGIRSSRSGSNIASDCPGPDGRPGPLS